MLKTEQERRYPEQYSTKELKKELAEWPKMYRSRMTGELVDNPILGYVHQGTVDFAEKCQAIVQLDGKWQINFPYYNLWENKVFATRWLADRRFYAKRQEHLSGRERCTMQRCIYCFTTSFSVLPNYD